MRNIKMKRDIIINATDSEIRIALLEEGRLAEIFVETPDKENPVGAIYLGKVKRVAQGMNAAFIDIGDSQDAFLHFSDAANASSELDTGEDDEDEAPQIIRKNNQHKKQGKQKKSKQDMTQGKPVANGQSNKNNSNLPTSRTENQETLSQKTASKQQEANQNSKNNQTNKSLIQKEPATTAKGKIGKTPKQGREKADTIGEQRAAQKSNKGKNNQNQSKTEKDKIEKDKIDQNKVEKASVKGLKKTDQISKNSNLTSKKSEVKVKNEAYNVTEKDDDKRQKGKKSGKVLDGDKKINVEPKVNIGAKKGGDEAKEVSSKKLLKHSATEQKKGKQLDKNNSANNVTQNDVGQKIQEEKLQVKTTEKNITKRNITKKNSVKKNSSNNNSSVIELFALGNEPTDKEIKSKEIKPEETKQKETKAQKKNNSKKTEIKGNIDETKVKDAKNYSSDAASGGKNSKGKVRKNKVQDSKLPIFQTKRSGTVTIDLANKQEILVQVIRERYAQKGMRVTTKISLPGRFLVLLPLEPVIGVSKKIESYAERRRLRRIAKEILPEGYGCIIRTVAREQNEEIIREELSHLLERWQGIEEKIKRAPNPSLIYSESSLVASIMRDLFSESVNRVVIDNKKVYDEIYGYVSWAAPDMIKKIEMYKQKQPIYEAFGIERELSRIFHRKLFLKSGGYLILEQTEAMMVVDVNSGRYKGGVEREQNALYTNLESAREIARQLRLRDVGGLVAIDFIDMQDEKNKRKVFEEIRREMQKDRAKAVVLPMSQFCIIQITRQRIRNQVVNSISEICRSCEGRGVVHSKSIVMKRIEQWLHDFKSSSREFRLSLAVNPSMIEFITEGNVSRLTKLMMKNFVRIKLIPDESLPVEEFRFFSHRLGMDITDNMAVA